VINEIPSLPASRSRLAAVLRASKNVVSVDLTSVTLDLDRQRAAKLLAGCGGSARAYTFLCRSTSPESSR
jgi:hypothetical protein